MNLIAMLEAANRPSEPKPAEKPHPRLQNLLLGGRAQSTKALKRYREIMSGRGWMTQTQIENALGYGSTVATKFLRKLLAYNKVERRNRNGAAIFSRRSGYEWRWVE